MSWLPTCHLQLQIYLYLTLTCPTCTLVLTACNVLSLQSHLLLLHILCPGDKVLLSFTELLVTLCKWKMNDTSQGRPYVVQTDKERDQCNHIYCMWWPFYLWDFLSLSVVVHTDVIVSYSALRNCCCCGDRFAPRDLAKTNCEAYLCVWQVLIASIYTRWTANAF